MQIQQQDMEDTEIDLELDIQPIKALRQKRRPYHHLLIAILFLVLLLLGYLFLTREAYQQSDEVAIPDEETKIQTTNPQTATPLTPQQSLFCDFKEQLSQLQNTIYRIQKSASSHVCLLPQKLYHYYVYNTQMMYFHTAYDLILPACQLIQTRPWSIDRQNIQIWNQNREVTQWAIRYVSPNDHVVYHRPKIYHIPQITILSKIVGEQGSITIIDNNQLAGCVRTAAEFHSLNTTIIYASPKQLDSAKDYNVFITSDTSGLFPNQISTSVKTLIYTQNPSTFKKHRGINIKKVTLPPQPCSQLQLSSQLSGQGFYSFLTQEDEQTQRQLLRQIPLNNNLTVLIEEDYAKFKQQYNNSIISKYNFVLDLKNQKKCYDIHSPRRVEDYVYTIYGHKFYNVTDEELKTWENERQVVEWVRSHLSNQTENNVYYQIQSKFNLIVILEIGLLLKNQTLTLVCPPADCDRLTRQIISNKMLNIDLLKLSDSKKALSSGMIITDNQTLIATSLQANFLSSGSLLGLFNYKDAKSLAFIRKLYVKYNLREIAVDSTKRQCIGFQYRHFFWRSWQPQGFYDITLSHDVMYAFWGGHPSKLTMRKKLLAEEVVSSSLQVKILSVESFISFQVAESPIHPAFYLLTTIQKSDYMRVYLMHFYGGGYTDVKHLHDDYRPYYEQFKKQEDKFALGYPEIHDYDVPCFEEGNPPCREIRTQYRRIIGNGCYFFKKRTVLTTEWYSRMIGTLDKKLDNLRKNPPRVPRECCGNNFMMPDGTWFTSKYPFRWAEIANEHLVRVQYKYLDYVSPVLPYIIVADYRTTQNLHQN